MAMRARWTIWANLFAACCFAVGFVLAVMAGHLALAVVYGAAAICFVLALSLGALSGRR
jgi:hypothetical protein